MDILSRNTDGTDLSMTMLDTSSFMEALADERLLEHEQYEELTSVMLPQCQDALILARELAYRGWLTPYQIEQIMADQAHTLILGSYVLLEPLGEGGMGRVYRARNWKLNRIVAIKVIREEQSRDPAVIARFQREIRALGKIRHPNIVLAVDADFRPGMIFYAMEYVEGADLGQYVRQHGPLPIADACNYIIQVADALQSAHDLGLIHRDIKPSNLLLTEPDHSIKLLDLGLTRCEVPIDDSVFIELTRAGALIGTPDFMSPEQVKDSRGADSRSDLYSLGCTFYYLLTGVAPFDHVRAIVDKLYAQCETEPRPIEELRGDIPPDIAEVIHKLLAKRRRDRFQSPNELIGVLLALFEDAQSQARETLIEAATFTLSEAPVLRVEMARTEILDHADIGFVTAPEEMEFHKKRSIGSLNRTQIIIALLIATLALLLIWMTGIGPGTLGGRVGATPNQPMLQSDGQGPEERMEQVEIRAKTPPLRLIGEKVDTTTPIANDER